MARTLTDHPTSTAMRAALTRTRPALAALLVPKSNAAGEGAAALSCEQPCDKACLPAVLHTWLLAPMRTGTAYGTLLAPEEGARGQIHVHRLLVMRRGKTGPMKDMHYSRFPIGISSREDRL